MNIDADNFLKITQAAFYITASALGILTFIKAKNGLLNTVNTEYHKKVIEKLYALSDELYEEFDADSDKFWAKNDESKELLEKFNESVVRFKHEIITKKFTPDSLGVPSTSNQMRLLNLTTKYKRLTRK